MSELIWPWSGTCDLFGQVEKKRKKSSDHDPKNGNSNFKNDNENTQL